MPKQTNALAVAVVALLMLTAAGAPRAEAVLTFSVSSASSWPNQAHHDAAVAAMQQVVDRYNAYGYFGNYNVWVYYDAGIPTAQASYGGSIGFGGTYPAERVTQHEMAHYLGLPSSGWSGLMTGGTWDGFHAVQRVRQFDGEQATLNGDSIHFWPYGLNYDSEGSEINKQRQVAIVYAMRADLGIGPSAHPSTATTVTATANDPSGQSGFNHKTIWSDGYFAHAGADYLTGDFAVRTPASANSFKFYGDSLTVNNTSASRGLYFKGQGTSAVVTFNNLILDGGWVYHLSNLSDLFQLGGVVTVESASNICAKQGNIDILASVAGSGALTIRPTDSPAVDDRYVRFYAWDNTFSGDLVNEARFELAEGANFAFTIGADGVNNAIIGPSAAATLLNGVFEIDLTAASDTVGDAWTLVTAANTTYGATFDIPGFSRNGSLWRNGQYEFDETTGVLTVVPAPSTWNVDGDGAWSNAAYWTEGVPAGGDDAILGPVLTAPAVIDLDVPATLNRLTFDNPNSYVVAGANALTLTGDAEIVVADGDHEIAVPVAGTAGLTVLGGGSITLSAASSYTGDTVVASGTLALAGVGGLSGTSAITVSPGATFDVSERTSPFQLTSGQSLHHHAADAVMGDVIVGNGGLIAGAGGFGGNVTATAGGVIRVGENGLSYFTPDIGLVHYVDATTGSRGNTSRTNGMAFYPIAEGVTGADNDWEARSLGNNGTLEAGGEVAEDAYEIKTTVKLLNPWESYEVFVLFWDPVSSAEDWNVRAGFGSNPGGNTLYAAADARIGNVTAPPASTLNFVTAPILDEGGRAMLAAQLGTHTANADGELAVFIDDMPSHIGANRRTLYDGLGIAQVGPVTMAVAGDVTLSAGAVLEIDVLTPANLDRLSVGGQFTAGGTLALTFIPQGSPPQLGDTYDLIDAAAFDGSFDGLIAPALPAGQAWDLRGLAIDGTISVADVAAAVADCVACMAGPGGGVQPGCAAQDADADGDVDLVDYAELQAALKTGQ